MLGSAASPTSRAQKQPAPPAVKPEDVAKRINTPRPDARTVTFETREGTWMSVDVSPDGGRSSSICWETCTRCRSRAAWRRRITRGPAFDHHPRFSPDGSTLAFTTDESGMENIWLVDADGRTVVR